jgi:hypothetical protein
MEIKSARDLRVLIAEYDIPVKEFAERAGLGSQYVSSLMHARLRITDEARERIEKVAEELANEPLPPEAPTRPQRASRLSPL